MICNAADPAIARILELRQYTLRPGQREVLIELFERELIEPQEALGMQILGQFRDLDRPNRFVWLRGFSGMEARRQGLAGFYGGPVWAAWGPAANATMIDSDDVLLLRPCGPTGGLRPNVHSRPSPGAKPDPGVLHAMIVTGDSAEVRTMTSRLSRDLDRALAEAGHRLLGCYETDPTPNNFPRLPVRTDTALVWFTTSRRQLRPVQQPAAAATSHSSPRPWPARQSQLEPPSPGRHLPLDTHRPRCQGRDKLDVCGERRMGAVRRDGRSGPQCTGRQQFTHNVRQHLPW